MKIRSPVSLTLIMLMVIAAVVPAALMGLLFHTEVSRISGSIQAQLGDINSTVINYSTSATDQELLVSSKALQYEEFFRRIAESNQFVADYVASGFSDIDRVADPNSSLSLTLRRAMKRNSAIERVYLATADGRLASWPEMDGTRNTARSSSDIHSLRWYTAAQAAGGTVWIPGDEMHMICAAPSYRNITLYCVAASEVSLSNIYSDLSGLRGSGYPFIVNRTGDLVMMPKVRRGDAPWDGLLISGNLYRSNISAFAELGDHISKGKSGSDFLTIDGRGWFVVYSPVKSVGWTVVVAYPSEQMMVPLSLMESSVNSISQRSAELMRSSSTAIFAKGLILIVISGAVFGFIGITVRRRFRRSAECISEALRRIGEGDLDKRLPADCDIAGIAESMESMRQSLRMLIDRARADGYERGAQDRERSVLKAFDRFLFADSMPPIEGYDLCVRQISRGGAFYDIQEIRPGRVALCMGRAGGDFMDSAVLAATARMVIRALLSSQPHDVIKRANGILARSSSLPISCFYAVLDYSSREMMYSNAGHAPPFVVGQDGSVDTLCGDGIPMAIRDGLDLGYERRSISEGDVLVIYSESMIEAQGFDLEHLIGVVRGSRAKSASEIADDIESAVPRRDGLAVIVMKAI
ncbi:MAG: SpoIIE family protein phosphatase [Methanothrix sp.]|nr:SpoIIE family protein phosphatase [Methanothrix sp.]MCX8206382.1 SpoIIE family protein phosphatase [Methanothrix sp.]